MGSEISRREFIAGLGVLAAHVPVAAAALQSSSTSGSSRLAKSPFKIAVITDEISQDFGHACEVASQRFGMEWIEIRTLWDKNIVNLDAAQIAEAKRLVKKNNLRVTDVASPLFKVDWPGAPKSKFSPAHDQFNADFTYDQQGDVLDRSMALAKEFSTDRVRCFDFWRLDDQSAYRHAINEALQNAAEKAGKIGLILILENESACNTATGAEAAKVLSAVPSPSFMINWDPGNAAMSGETPYPDAYNLLPKGRIGHCHCKDAIKTARGYEWAAIGKGIIDWTGQFAALKRDGYHHVVSLETHWRGAGTPEASSTQSCAGMKEALEKAGAL
ncbi:MAG TPA: sugar phosphate isomerase/epimerase family protein [Terriglobales bacterium]|nr:sugar phosphate isomerase/epimerase family protein [Terriglobales bacterium]